MGDVKKVMIAILLAVVCVIINAVYSKHQARQYAEHHRERGDVEQLAGDVTELTFVTEGALELLPFLVARDQAALDVCIGDARKPFLKRIDAYRSVEDHEVLGPDSPHFVKALDGEAPKERYVRASEGSGRGIMRRLRDGDFFFDLDGQYVLTTYDSRGNPFVPPYDERYPTKGKAMMAMAEIVDRLPSIRDPQEREVVSAQSDWLLHTFMKANLTEAESRGTTRREQS